MLNTAKKITKNKILFLYNICFIGLGRFSKRGGGGSNNCERKEQTERLHKAFTGVQGKICILQAKYAQFQAFFGLNLQKYMSSGGRKGAALLFWKECVFWGTTDVQFQSLFCQNIAWENFVLYELNMHNFMPFLVSIYRNMCFLVVAREQSLFS